MAAEHSPTHFLVLDFEATCVEGATIQPQEVIEFPCLLVRAADMVVEDQFHEYVRPVAHPTLSPFCTQLTGITQEMVQDRSAFPEVLGRFVGWYQGLGLSPATAAFLTCGQWDLATMLPNQCTYSGLAIPPMLDVSTSGQFVNIKLTFQAAMGRYAKGIKDMQTHLGLAFQGRLHSGIDDCRNILLVARELHARGVTISNNGMTKK